MAAVFRAPRGGGLWCCSWRMPSMPTLGCLDFLDHLIDWARTCPSSCLFARPGPGPGPAGFGAGRSRIALTSNRWMRPRWTGWWTRWCPGCRRGPGRRSPARPGVPLFAVETMPSLIGRDIVQPIEGGYRLVGDVGKAGRAGQPAALLADRLDAFDPGVGGWSATPRSSRHVPGRGADRMSGQDEAAVGVGLAESVRGRSCLCPPSGCPPAGHPSGSADPAPGRL